MATMSEVLMKLVLRGIEPGEAQRLASASLTQLEGELQASLGRQVEAHQLAQLATTKQDESFVKDEVSRARKRTADLAAAAKALTDEQNRLAQEATREAKRQSDEVMRMGRLQSQALEENARRDARVANEARKAHEEAERAKARASKEAAEEHAKRWEMSFHKLGVIVASKELLGFFSEMGHKVFELGEEINRTSQIYDSLKGSIEGLREATNGQVADIDLILAKNDAFQKDLKLTDEQFAIAGKAAQVFSSSMGISVKDALMSMVDGLATGRMKLLESVGVTVTAKEAYDEYAKKIHVAVGKLSEHQQKVAIIEASLRAMDKALVKNGTEVHSFSTEWEQATAALANLGEEMKLGLGPVVLWMIDQFDNFTNAIARSILELKLSFAQIDSFVSKADHYINKTLGLPAGKGNSGEDDVAIAKKNLADFDAMLKNVAKAREENNEKEIQKARDRLKKGTAYEADKAVGGSNTPGKVPDTGFKGVDPITKAINDVLAKEMVDRQEQMNALRDLNDLLDNPDKYLSEKAKPAQFTANQGRSQDIADVIQAGMSRPERYGAHFGAILPDGSEMGPVYKPPRSDVRFNEGIDSSDNAAQENIKRWLDQELAKMIGLDKVDSSKSLSSITSAEAISPEAAADQAAINDIITRGGGQIEDLAKGKEQKLSFFQKMLFGEDGPEGIYAQSKQLAEDIGTVAQDMNDMLNSTGAAMAGALGKSIAASIGEGKNFATVLKQTTHAVLMSLSEQAIVKALMETAEGFAALANPATAVDAPLHFHAAAAFGAVGVAAGVGAAATNSSSAGTGAGASPGGGATRSGGGGGARDGGGGEDRPPVNIYLNVLPGGEAQAGASIVSAMEAWQAQTGTSLFQRLGG